MQFPGNQDPNFQAIISEAHFLRQHGRYEAAWARLEDLEPIDRVEPETLAVRLRLCVDLAPPRHPATIPCTPAMDWRWPPPGAGYA